MTLSIEDKTRRTMKRFPEVNWSGFIRKKIEEKTQELAWKEEMLKKLRGEEAETQLAVLEGRKVNSAMAQRLKKEGLL